jgi:outer membrane protein assembly factor BamD (BamD/ComL family)
VDLLENAKAFFKIGNRLQYHTYQKPVDMCRTVMKDYPNTKYATEAQILLRKVPERFRERYNLTDEELGL